MNDYSDYEKSIRSFVRKNREGYSFMGDCFAFGYFNGNGGGFDCELGLIAVGDSLESVERRISELYKNENRYLDLSKSVLKGTLDEIISPSEEDDLGIFNEF